VFPASQSFATLTAAFLGAFVALITIIITKEQKVSEFRQAWINAFRDDLADAISSASTLTVIVQRSNPVNEQDMYREWSRFTAALARIELRLNLSEEPHRRLEQFIRKAEELMRDMELSPESYHPGEWMELQTDIVAASQKLLKIEWNRVKQGERYYRSAKIALLFVVFILPLVVLTKYLAKISG